MRNESMWTMFMRLIQAAVVRDMDKVESIQATMGRSIYFSQWSEYFLPLARGHHLHSLAGWEYLRRVNPSHKEIAFWSQQSGLWVNVINALVEVIDCGHIAAEAASETVHISQREYMLQQQNQLAA